MNLPRCDQEEAVATAARAGRLGEDLRDHASACPVCADVLLVTEFLLRQAAATSAEPLPDPGLIWFKARIQARRSAAEKALQPIAVTEKLAWAGGVVAATALLAWFQPDLLGWVHGIASMWTSATSSGFTLHRSLFVIAGFGLLPVFLALSILHSVPARD